MSDPAIRHPQRQQRPPGALKPVLAIVGHSGSGKTSLLERLLPILTKAGLRVGLMKHAHQGFDMDRPGKDSYRLRAAGAHQVMVASAQHWALLADTPAQEEPDLESLLTRLDQANMDLILLEGFKHADLPKLEVYRPAHGKPPLYPSDPRIIAVATDSSTALDGIEALDLNRPQHVADFIRSTLLVRESSHAGF